MSGDLFLKTIERIEYFCQFALDPDHELSPEELSYGVIKVMCFADQEYDLGWQKAVDRLKAAIDQGTEAQIEFEISLYEETCLRFVEAYKKKIRKEKAHKFMNSLLNKKTLRHESPMVQQTLNLEETPHGRDPVPRKK